MQYIAHKRFKQKSISGNVNISAYSICEEQNGIIFYNNNPICAVTSENAHQYFSRNDDACGIERGKLVKSIQKTLAQRESKEDPVYQARWDKVWDDKLCQKYKRVEHQDFWLWNNDFYNAPIFDLRYIAELVGASK